MLIGKRYASPQAPLSQHTTKEKRQYVCTRGFCVGLNYLSHFKGELKVRSIFCFNLLFKHQPCKIHFINTHFVAALILQNKETPNSLNSQEKSTFSIAKANVNWRSRDWLLTLEFLTKSKNLTLFSSLLQLGRTSHNNTNKYKRARTHTHTHARTKQRNKTTNRQASLQTPPKQSIQSHTNVDSQHKIWARTPKTLPHPNKVTTELQQNKYMHTHTHNPIGHKQTHKQQTADTKLTLLS